jgi:hypothetical protein
MAGKCCPILIMPTSKLLGYSFKEIGFLIIWFGTVLLPLLYGITKIYPKKSLPSKPQGYCLDRTRLTRNSWSGIIGFWTSIILMVSFGIFYIYLILYDVDFVGGDYSHFTYFSVRDKVYPMPIWSGQGRFFPFGHQEFNLISIFSKSPIIYSVFVVIQYLAIFALSLVALQELMLVHRVLTILVLTSSPSFTISFLNIIFPERNVIFWLIIFVVAVKFFDRNRYQSSFCVALVATQVALYYKEPVFILITIFAFTRLMVKFLSKKNLLEKTQVIKFIKDQWLEFSLLFLVSVFLLLYGIIIASKVKISYAETRVLKGTQFDVFTQYLQSDPFLTIFLVVFSLRIVWLLVNKKTIDLLWDALAMGAIFYFLVYVWLKIASPYYLAPVNFIGILYTSWIGYKITCHGFRKFQLGIILTLVTILFIHSVSLSSSIVLQRKKFIDSHVQLAQFLRDYAPKKEAGIIDVYLPVSSSYWSMELSSFLDYKGIKLYPKNYHYLTPLEKSKAFLRMNLPEKLKNNTCTSWMPYRCYELNHPNPDDLVIILPTQKGDISRIELAKYQANSELIFHYQPQFSPVERGLVFLSGDNRFGGEWMNVYIFQTKQKP